MLDEKDWRGGVRGCGGKGQCHSRGRSSQKEGRLLLLGGAYLGSHCLGEGTGTDDRGITCRWFFAETSEQGSLRPMCAQVWEGQNGLTSEPWAS